MNSKLLLITTCIAIFFVFCVAVLFIFYFNIINENIYNSDITFTLGIITALATTALAAIAYINLFSISRSGVDDNIINLDAQWRSDQIIRARKIIDDIFQKHYRVNSESKGDYILTLNNVSNDIYLLSCPKTESDIKINGAKFIEILALIEFFDTLGYLYKNGNKGIKKQIDDLFKHSTNFYYEVTKNYVENANSKNDGRFKNFCELFKALKK